MDPNSIYNSSSSSDEDEGNLLMMNLYIQTQEMMLSRIHSNNLLIQHLRDQQSHQVTRRGSVPGHIVINRDREGAHVRLYNDYFADNPLYNEAMFRRKFRMSRSLFVRIVDAVKEHDDYFVQRRDATGRLGLSPLQKVTSAIHILTRGVLPDATDEYVKLSESSAIKSLKRFCRAIMEIFSTQYLRAPTSSDIARLLYIGEHHGFPGMLGSLGCMHWKWQNCPTGWSSSHCGNPTIILEAIADYDLWIWHAYFGFPDTSNDVNVSASSNLFYNLTQGIAPPAHYVIQGKEYNMGYYLADSIYPKWSTIVQTIEEPRSPKTEYFAMKQEACKKDLERAISALQARFTIVAGPVRHWDKDAFRDIMITCIILHNMIVEDERDLTSPIEIAREAPQPEVEMATNEDARFQEYLSRYEAIRIKNAHLELQNALVNHLWEQRSDFEF
ncbi:uncharacterized protein LOC125219839 isoform X1 [Salvia hispanica]|uniref:uncharacterized protein LOC125219839 isoform X1 n=2 Tax=Salvia hispanica TaxID=49212 RepID=UPI00200919C7|nr:uncharacterized protein LOC125219839 isoform X1 [Salvia hispanica]